MLRKHRLAGPLAAGRGSGHMVSSQRRKSSFASLAWSRQVPVEVARHLLLRLEEFGHAQEAQLCLIVLASRAGAWCMQLRHGQDHHAQGQHHQRTRAEACSVLRMGSFIILCSAWFGKPFRKLHTLHSTLNTSHSTLYTPDFTLHTPHFTLHTSHFALSTLHTLHSKLYTPHF